MKEKKIDNVEIASELHEIKNRIIELEKASKDQKDSLYDEEVFKFLLAEFNEIGQFWRHTDSRTETSFNLYFTISAVGVSGLVLISQQIKDFSSFLAISTFFAAGLFIIGLVLIERIKQTELITREYQIALNLIRRFYCEFDQRLGKYLFLPITDQSFKDKNISDSISNNRKPRFFGVGTIAIFVWQGVLLGFCLSSLAWMIQPRLLPAVIKGIGILTSITCFILLAFYTKRIEKKFWSEKAKSIANLRSI